MFIINIISKGLYWNVLWSQCVRMCQSPCNSCVASTVFRVELSCTGRLDSDVTILMQLNLTINSSKNITVLNFKRRKMCYKSKIQFLMLESFYCLSVIGKGSGMVYEPGTGVTVNFGEDQKKSGKILPFRGEWGLLVKAEAGECTISSRVLLHWLTFLYIYNKKHFLSVWKEKTAAFWLFKLF